MKDESEGICLIHPSSFILLRPHGATRFLGVRSSNKKKAIARNPKIPAVRRSQVEKREQRQDEGQHEPGREDQARGWCELPSE